MLTAIYSLFNQHPLNAPVFGPLDLLTVQSADGRYRSACGPRLCFFCRHPGLQWRRKNPRLQACCKQGKTQSVGKNAMNMHPHTRQNIYQFFDDNVVGCSVCSLLVAFYPLKDSLFFSAASNISCFNADVACSFASS